MLHRPTTPPARKEQSFSGLKVGGIMAGAFVVGAVVAFGYSSWQAQTEQLATLRTMVERMQQQDAEAEAVTRDAPLDLLSVAAPAPAPAPAAQAAAVVVAAAPAPAPEVAPAPVAPASTADKLRTLVQASVEAPLDDARLKDARRLETLAIINAGVQELAAAVVAGNYEIHTNYKDADFSGRIHFAFVGHEKDQTELERFLAVAAEEGTIAHSSSVVGSDGSVNGHIMLFDLVERTLENGTLEQQAAVAKMRKEAVEMLAADVKVGEPQNAAGERFYVVESGDSLAYIALQYYGNTNDYVRIFEANRDKLRSAERIQVGQRLRIPKA
jgi:nucleoid-associated protein YgaU